MTGVWHIGCHLLSMYEALSYIPSAKERREQHHAELSIGFWVRASHGAEDECRGRCLVTASKHRQPGVLLANPQFVFVTPCRVWARLYSLLLVKVYSSH